MPSHGSQQFFANARNVAISGGTFTNIQASNSTREGFKLLLGNISMGAVYNAAERGAPPRCHPHTREAIRAEIMEWVTAPRGLRKLILWMHGPAGSGKTAIAQSIAEECAELEILAASFFFWRTAAGRNDASRFIATIAYQLSRYIPQMEEHLLTAIERDPTIFHLSLSTQMRVLVIDPLKLAAPSLSTAMFAIVDGVDECGLDGRSQSELLHLLASLASEFQHLPIIFLIASRPEYEIREAFNQNLLNPLKKVLILDNNYKPDEDIKLYFDSTFRRISKEHRRLGRRLPWPWPAAGDVHSLVSKASGQFIFAATVTKFIDSPRYNPVDRMNIVLRLSTSGNETPFTLLDALYRSILDTIADIEKVLDILTFLFLHRKYSHHLDTAEEILGIEFRSALVDMHSLVCVPPPSDILANLPTVYHASLEDFLMDQSRSHQYYIGRSEGHLRISRRCLTTIGGFPHIQHLMNVVGHFSYHAEQSPASEDSANNLAQFDLRAVLEGISDLKNDLYNIDWQRFFDGAKKLVGLDRLDIVLRLQNDFDMFLLERISQYPPSLRSHIPVLLCLLRYDFPGDIFRILLLGTSNSAEEYTEFLNLDKRLLNVFEAFNEIKESAYMIYESLFLDKSRAGDYFVDGESYAALAKAIIGVIYSKSGERSHTIRFVNDITRYSTNLYVEDGRYPTTQIYIRNKEFAIMGAALKNASTDWDLDNFLRERVFRTNNMWNPQKAGE